MQEYPQPLTPGVPDGVRDGDWRGGVKMVFSSSKNRSMYFFGTGKVMPVISGISHYGFPSMRR